MPGHVPPRAPTLQALPQWPEAGSPVGFTTGSAVPTTACRTLAAAAPETLEIQEKSSPKIKYWALRINKQRGSLGAYSLVGSLTKIQ